MPTHFLILIVCGPVALFVSWLIFCLVIDRRHAEKPADAALIISAAGRWFPMRLRSAPKGELDLKKTVQVT